MSAAELLIWIGVYAASAVVLAFLLNLLRKTGKTARIIILTAEIITAFVISGLYMIVLPSTPVIFVLLIPFLWGDAAVTLVWGSAYKLLKPKYKFLKKFAWLFSVIISTVIFTYGTVNMQATVRKDYELHSEKLSNTYKIAFISDLHCGSAKLLENILGACRAINEAKPDMLIIGGDMVDEFSTPEDLNNYLSALSEVETPLGKYFIFGNHEYLIPANSDDPNILSRETLIKRLGEYDIKILDDDIAEINDDLVLIGMDDVSSPDSSHDRLLSYDNGGKYVVVIDHQSLGHEEIKATLASDLQLSGHTHAGQTFALPPLYAAAIKYVYGLYDDGGTFRIVSSGLAGWEYPYRTAGHCEYVILTIAPK